MILDTSAVVAMLFEEPGYEALVEKLESASTLGVGAPTLVEIGLVVTARAGIGARGLVQRFLQAADVTTIAFRDTHWLVAVEAFERFGRGRHPARLNLGDCFSYATATIARRPLLFVGDDFGQTDIAVA